MKFNPREQGCYGAVEAFIIYREKIDASPRVQSIGAIRYDIDILTVKQKSEDRTYNQI